jgi:hypothetical protein
MARLPATTTALDIGSLIVGVREQRVILDADLAHIYGVRTFRFNEAVKRNVRRFPRDFRFQLTKEEWTAVRSLRSQPAIREEGNVLTSQIAMSKKGRGGRRTLPYVFTEHGALMAANVLNSERAVEMSVYVIRAFVSMRRELTRHRDLARRLAEMEKTLIGHDAALRDLYGKIRALLLPPAAAKPRGIGFHVKEAAARYHRRPVRRV